MKWISKNEIEIPISIEDLPKYQKMLEAQMEMKPVVILSGTGSGGPVDKAPDRAFIRLRFIATKEVDE